MGTSNNPVVPAQAGTQSFQVLENTMGWIPAPTLKHAGAGPHLKTRWGRPRWNDELLRLIEVPKFETQARVRLKGQKCLEMPANASVSLFRSSQRRFRDIVGFQCAAAGRTLPRRTAIAMVFHDDRIAK